MHMHTRPRLLSRPEEVFVEVALEEAGQSSSKKRCKHVHQVRSYLERIVQCFAATDTGTMNIGTMRDVKLEIRIVIHLEYYLDHAYGGVEAAATYPSREQQSRQKAQANGHRVDQVVPLVAIMLDDLEDVVDEQERAESFD